MTRSGSGSPLVPGGNAQPTQVAVIAVPHCNGSKVSCERIFHFDGGLYRPHRLIASYNTHTACNVATLFSVFNLEDKACQVIVSVVAERNNSVNGQACTGVAT